MGERRVDRIVQVLEDRNGRAKISEIRDEALGDSQRGLSAREIADLLGLKQQTVYNYLSDPDRKRSLGERLRSDVEVRSRALAIVAEKRE